MVAKGSATADAVEHFAQLSSTTAVVAANLTQLFTPDDRGYYEFNRSAIRFIPDIDFSKIRDDECSSTSPNSKLMVQASLVPMVIDNDGGGERAYDIYSLLLKERIVFLSGEINDTMANIVVAQLLYLSSRDPKRQINLYIQSPGGIVYSGMAIYDTIRMLGTPVSTVALGFTGSMATFLLSAGTPGKRYALAHATIHNHPTGGGSRGYTEDVRIATREQERLQAQIFHLMGKHCGRSGKEVEEFFLRDKYLNAQEAKDFGIVDEILGDIGDLVVLNSVLPEVGLLSALSLTTRNNS